MIVWDIYNNYNKIYEIDTNYGGFICSCLILFNIKRNNNLDFLKCQNKNNENFIVTSTKFLSNDKIKACTKIYSLNDGKLIRPINNTNKDSTLYLIYWENKINKEHFIIELNNDKIFIYNFFSSEIYAIFEKTPESFHPSGFIYQKKGKLFNNFEKDFLVCSSGNGNIRIWDLYLKVLDKNIKVTKTELMHILQWNKELIIAADFQKKSFKVINIEEGNVVNNYGGKHTGKVKCVKKIKHPIYGDVILSSGDDDKIMLWIIDKSN